MSGNLRNRVVMGLLVIAALLLTVGIFVIRGARQFVARSHWVEHTHDVLNALEHVYATVKDIEADQRGYLLTGRTELEQEFLSNLPAARAAAENVVRLLLDNPEQAARAAQLQQLVEKRLQASLEAYTTYKTSGFDRARTLVAVGPGIDLMSQIREIHKTMATQERTLLAQRMTLSETSARTLELSTVLGLGIGLVLFVLVARRLLVEVRERQRAEAETSGANTELTKSIAELAMREDHTHGHGGGDALLTQAGRILRAHCRAEDIACRYGGEEFTVILPETDTERARLRAEEIRLAVERLRVQHRREPLGSVTASIGIATFPDSSRDVGDLLRRADAALYKAKQQGRNRVVVD